MADEIESFSGMLRQALGDRLAADADSFVEIMAEDGVMEFPYAPAGLAKRVTGQAAIGAHLAMVGSLIAFRGMGTPTVLATTDPGVTVLEFTASGEGTRTGKPYEQRYISVIHTADGRITLYRDYWNPLVLLTATKQVSIADAITFDAADHG